MAEDLNLTGESTHDSPEPGSKAREHVAELLQQIAYTAEEVEALRSIISMVPADLLVVPSETGVSIKQILGHMAVRDADMTSLLGMDGMGDPVTVSETNWDLQPVDEILGCLQGGRRSLVAGLESVTAGAGDDVIEGLILHLERLVQQDVDAFREVATRLYSGGMGKP